MNDNIIFKFEFPHDKVAFAVKTLFKDIDYLFEIIITKEGFPNTGEFKGAFLNEARFELRGSNILFLDEKEFKYIDRLCICRNVYENGGDPVQIQIISENDGDAEIEVTIGVSNENLTTEKINFRVIDTEKYTAH